jgi:MT0933-like antitoxin protein
VNMMNSAKKFAMKNKEKIAAGVDKASDMVDKKTHGKYHDKLEKVDAAAAKFGGKPKEATPAGADAPAQPGATPQDGAAEQAAAATTEAGGD